ncbi:AraC family transcriptional regulator [Undibacterium sp.]|jgi:AraC-like DNA-binding protein|uniref:AraC family transcriptional regulator n=1 Tax=Undibacterium sp. TaxID=1914977 RepID=UPI002BC22DFE|nr:AraC family transcriptional regulator [Undibacterium sp.]HTD04279.1 AraC family transcriptional regulator [Undibacterium sp.]
MASRTERTDITIWQAPDLKAELLCGRFVDFTYDVHTHETACFALLTEGAIRIRMRGNEFVVQKGDIYAIDADEPHAGWAVNEYGWHLRTLYVDLAHLSSLAGNEQRLHPFRLAGPVVRDAQLAQWLYSVHRCSQEQGSSLFRDEAYIKFASQLTLCHARNPTTSRQAGMEPAGVQSVREFLDQNLEDHVSLEDLASIAGLPSFQLFRAFERALGMTPHAYQRQARVRLAMRLIRANHSLGDTSVLSGFSDQAHLTRWFQRFMGITPGQYQKAVTGRTTR